MSVPVIYEYIGQQTRDHFITLSDYFPPFSLGVFFLAVVAVVLASFFSQQKTGDTEQLDNIVLLGATLSLAVMAARSCDRLLLATRCALYGPYSNAACPADPR